MNSRSGHRTGRTAGLTALLIACIACVAAGEPLTDFKDPLGYYSIQLPPGHSQTDQSTHAKSKRSFNYGPSLSMWIIASEMPKPWNPQESMDKKVAEITAGRSPIGRPVEIERHELLQLGGADGYELLMTDRQESPSKWASAFALVGGQSAYSIAITCDDKKQHAQYEQLVQAVRDSFQAHGRPAPAPPSTPKTTPTAGRAAEPKPPAPDNWALARASLKVNGVMKQGNQRMALIGSGIFYEQDVVSTLHQGREYRFRITAIGDQKEQVQLESLPD